VKNAYINYKTYSVGFNVADGRFFITYDGMGHVVREALVTAVEHDGEWISLDENVSYDYRPCFRETGSELTVTYSGDAVSRVGGFELRFRADDKGVHLTPVSAGADNVRIEGDLRWGDHEQKETLACAIDRGQLDLRAAFGPATSTADNALFDKDTDKAVVFNANASSFRMHYSWDKNAYTFVYTGKPGVASLTAWIKKRVYEDTFQIDYQKLVPNDTFPTPPVGFMTWYALQFGANEERILANTAWQKENLMEYGADTVWVDAEWRQRDNSGQGRDGMDNYHPNQENYPHGMRYLSDKIREAGFVPAIWISPTVETRPNTYMQETPELTVRTHVSWCGRYWLDCSHPDFLTKALKDMLLLAKDEWGFDAIKWDVMTETIWSLDAVHNSLYASDKSTRQIMMDMCRAAREYVGEGYPLLACCGQNNRDLDVFCSVFDLARIGGDIFSWEHFMSQLIDPLFRYYSLHTVVVNADPDNVILRPQFSTYHQAITRATIVSMLGLPYTFGDDLVALPEDRVNIIKRTIPSIVSRPMDIRGTTFDGNSLTINTYIEKPEENYLVTSISNLTDRPLVKILSVTDDWHLDPGNYYVYDYWMDSYVGLISNSVTVTLNPYETKVFSVRPQADHPQVISTSRHISQGADDLISVSYDPETRIMTGRSKGIAGVPYTVTFAHGSCRNLGFEYVNDIVSTGVIRTHTWGVWSATFYPEATGEFEWQIPFARGGGDWGKYQRYDD